MTSNTLGLLERFQSFFILGGIGVGLLLSHIPQVATYGEKVILPALMLMLYNIFLHMPIQSLKAGFTNIKVTSLSLLVNFLVTPLLAFGLGFLFLRDTPDLWIGFFMLMLTPCTDWYLVFTGMAKGDVGLGASLLPWNLLLQLALLPVYLAILAGNIVPIEINVLAKSVLLVFVIPFVTAFLTRYLITFFKSADFLERIFLPKTQNWYFLFLVIAVTGMFSFQGRAVLNNPLIFLKLLIPIILFFVVIYGLSQGLGKLFKFTYAELACFTCTTAARNSPIALAIAVTAFPEQPLIALALVIGPLVELPVLFLITNRLLKKRVCLNKS